MKGWNTIGQFARKVGVSPKALRLYEDMGLLRSHTRGENGYRYYHDNQVELAARLKEFKDLGFTLAEIKGLLDADQELGAEKIAQLMRGRLSLISAQLAQLRDQETQIKNILLSLEKKSEPLKAQQRRAIMSFYGKVSIVVTGRDGLEKAAAYIQGHFENAQHSIPIIKWEKGAFSNIAKPYILVVPENDLGSSEIRKIHPDVIVVQNLGEHSEENQRKYLNLYSGIGPHVNTIINADDRCSVEFAGQPIVKKGRIFYFSKNRALEPQIRNIGGVVSDGDEVEVYGFNLNPEPMNLRLQRIMPIQDEVALLSSLGAVMTIGFEKAHLQLS